MSKFKCDRPILKAVTAVLMFVSIVMNGIDHDWDTMFAWLCALGWLGNCALTESYKNYKLYDK